jgi:hypothetical protein
MLIAYRRDGSPVHNGDTITSVQGDDVVFERAAYLSADASKSKIIIRNDRDLVVHSYACLYSLSVAEDTPAPAARPPVPARVTPESAEPSAATPQRPEHDPFALPPGYHGKPSGSQEDTIDALAGRLSRAGIWFDNQTPATKIKTVLVGVAAAILGLFLFAVIGSAMSGSGPNWNQNGYNYAVASYNANANNDPAQVYGSIGATGEEYLACRYVYINEVPDAGGGTDTAGVPYNAPSDRAPESAADAWISGCTSGLTHVGQ